MTCFAPSTPSFVHPASHVLSCGRPRVFALPVNMVAFPYAPSTPAARLLLAAPSSLQKFALLVALLWNSVPAPVAHSFLYSASLINGVFRGKYAI
jgi:hypothetical protein